jgi:hypothetical protein
MEKLTPQTPNSNEEIMTQQEMIVQLFETFLNDGGAPKVTAFKRTVDQLIKDNVKALCVHSGKAAEVSGWRSELKERFSGRGLKWVKIDNTLIEPSLKALEEDEDIDCSNYRALTQAAGYSWIRFAGPRIDLNQKSAAFEIRTSGSKIDHPNQLFYANVENLDSVIQHLNGTPHSLKLEVVADVKAAAEVEDAQDITDADAAMGESGASIPFEAISIEKEVPVSDASSEEQEVELDDAVLIIDEDGFAEIIESEDDQVIA